MGLFAHPHAETKEQASAAKYGEIDAYTSKVEQLFESLKIEGWVLDSALIVFPVLDSLRTEDRVPIARFRVTTRDAVQDRAIRTRLRFYFPFVRSRSMAENVRLLSDLVRREAPAEGR